MPDLMDPERATQTLMRLLAIEGTTGHEAAIAKEVTKMLREVGVPAKAIRHDDAHTRIPVPTPVGNLIVHLPGNRAGGRRLFLAHMDTVPLCAGAKPVRKGDRIVAAGKTALGGDDRTGVAVLVNLAETLLKHDLPRPDVLLVFTVREESGLHGARHLNPADLGGAKMGYNFDSRLASEVVFAAVGAERWEVEIHGKAAHAGVCPEKGISATAVASIAIADVVRGGWFGKVVKGDAQGTSNVGSISGADGGSAGQATNVVTDYVFIRGESRSHNPKFAKEITTAYKQAFAAAGVQVHDDAGRPAKVKFTSRLDYAPFRLKESAAVIKIAEHAVRSIGLEPRLKVANGGLDANWLFKHGVPTVTFGAGQNLIHTVDEFVDVSEFVRGCRVAIALATAEETG